MAVSGEVLAEMAGSMWAEIEAKALAKVETTMKVHAASAALEAAAAPYVDRWIAAAEAQGFDARAALDFYMATVTKLAAQ